MIWWDAVSGGVGYFVGKTADLFGAASFFRDRKEDRAKARWEIRRSYDEAWARVYATAGWEGIMDKTRDLVQFPRTEAETRCVRHILAHFERTLTEYRAGRYKLPSHTADDVRNLLSYPVFLDAWGELKRYHEPETVDFVEQALSRMR